MLTSTSTPEQKIIPALTQQESNGLLEYALSGNQECVMEVEKNFPQLFCHSEKNFDKGLTHPCQLENMKED